LKVGGRLAIPDIVTTAELPSEIINDIDALTGCITGASSIVTLQRMLEQSGFTDIVIEPKDESRDFLENWVLGKRVDDYIISATIKTVKP